MAQEYRTEEDKCCRYLSTSLYRDTGSSKFEAGAFGIYIEKRLGITCIPYGISMADLITERALIPDLFIKLPKKFSSKNGKIFHIQILSLHLRRDGFSLISGTWRTSRILYIPMTMT